MTIAESLAERRIARVDIISARGVWDPTGKKFDFPDGSRGRFEDLSQSPCGIDTWGRPTFGFKALP